MGQFALVKYNYESGQLTRVTMPGEAEPRWRLEYDGSNGITQVADGRGGKTKVRGHRRRSLLTTLSNALQAEHNSCFDFTSNEIAGLLVLLAGSAPGGLLEGVPGGAGGLSPVGHRVLEIAHDAPGLFLEFAHAIQGK